MVTRCHGHLVRSDACSPLLRVLGPLLPDRWCSFTRSFRLFLPRFVALGASPRGEHGSLGGLSISARRHRQGLTPRVALFTREHSILSSFRQLFFLFSHCRVVPALVSLLHLASTRCPRCDNFALQSIFSFPESCVYAYALARDIITILLDTHRRLIPQVF